MATRVTDGSRRERHSLSSRAAALVSRVSRLRRSRACTPLTKSDEKERLLAVYHRGCVAYKWCMLMHCDKVKTKTELGILMQHQVFLLLVILTCICVLSAGPRLGCNCGSCRRWWNAQWDLYCSQSNKAWYQDLCCWAFKCRWLCKVLCCKREDSSYE